MSPVNEMVETGYVATYLTPGLPVEFDAITGEWFKIGVSMQNDTDTDITVYVEVEGVEVFSQPTKARTQTNVKTNAMYFLIFHKPPIFFASPIYLQSRAKNYIKIKSFTIYLPLI